MQSFACLFNQPLRARLRKQGSHQPLLAAEGTSVDTLLRDTVDQPREMMMGDRLA